MNFFTLPDPTALESTTRESAGKAPLRNLAPALLLTLVPVLILGLYGHRMVAGLVNSDAMDYAQIGRNVLAGHGFTTQILRPLALTDSANPLTQPDLTHGPLYPLLLAIAFGMGGAKDGVVLAMSGLFYVLTVPVLYFLGKRLFSKQVGLLAALIFMANDKILEAASSGAPTTLVMFLATCLFLTLFQAANVARREGEEATAKVVKAPFVLAGLLGGLLYLTDPLFIWILPVLTVAVPLMFPAKHPSRQATATCLFLLPLALLTLPCMLRFGMLAGNPFFGLRGAELWMGTKSYPGFIAYRLSPGDVVGGFAGIKGVLAKLFFSATGAITSLLYLPASWILLFVLPGLFFGFAEPALGRIRTLVFACLISGFVGSLFLTYNSAVIMFAFPGLLVYALHYLVHLVRQARLPQSSLVMVIGLFGIALLSPLASGLAATHTPVAVPQIAVARSLSQQSHPDEIVFSDQPWIVAWYADRASIWIPAKDYRMVQLRKQFVKARWLFLTPEASSLSPEWNLALNDLAKWDRSYQEAQKAGSTLPAPLKITRGQAPITEALEGFDTVPPVDNGPLTAVVAAASP